MLKKMFQAALVRYGSTWLFKKYVKKYRLEDEVVDLLIQENRTERLMEYIKHQELSSRHLTGILSGEMNDLTLHSVRNNILDNEQQQLLVSKKNILLLEAYLSPEGYFDLARRFKPAAEQMYILSMAQSEKKIGVEVFKAYIDNTSRDVITEGLLKAILPYDSFATHYVLHKAVLKKEHEEYLVKNAQEHLIGEYIKDHELASDAAQLALVEENFELAKKHFNLYGLRSQAQQRYHALRKQAIERSQAETVP